MSDRDQKDRQEPAEETPSISSSQEASPDTSTPLDLDFLSEEGGEPIPITFLGGGPGVGDQEVRHPVPDRAVLSLHETGKEKPLPTALGRLSHYVICDHKDLIARWGGDGKGWMVKLRDGFVRTAIVPTSFPTVGNFVLVEVGLERGEDGLHLTHVTSYRLAEHHALAKLSKSDSAILAAITGLTTLNNRQKKLVREQMATHFLPALLQRLDELLEAC